MESWERSGEESDEDRRVETKQEGGNKRSVEKGVDRTVDMGLKKVIFIYMNESVFVLPQFAQDHAALLMVVSTFLLCHCLRWV